MKNVDLNVRLENGRWVAIVRTEKSFWSSWDRDPQWWGYGPTRAAALQSLRRNVQRDHEWKGSSYQNVGRKPRGYYESGDVLRLLDEAGGTPQLAQTA